MRIIAQRDAAETKRLKSLQIPPRYIFKEGVYDIPNYRFIKLPRPSNKPKSCIMEYVAQCTVFGCEKLRFSWFIDEVDYRVMSEKHPAYGPEELEKWILFNIRQQFTHALEYKKDEAMQLVKAKMMIDKFGMRQLPDPLKVQGNGNRLLLR